MSEPLFRALGGQCNPGSITVPLRYAGSVSLDGLDVAPGPQTVTLDLRAGGGIAHRLVVQSEGSGRPQVTEHPAL